MKSSLNSDSKTASFSSVHHCALLQARTGSNLQQGIRCHAIHVFSSKQDWRRSGVSEQIGKTFCMLGLYLSFWFSDKWSRVDMQPTDLWDNWKHTDLPTRARLTCVPSKTAHLLKKKSNKNKPIKKTSTTPDPKTLERLFWPWSRI